VVRKSQEPRSEASEGDRFFSYSGGSLKQRRSFSDLRPFVSEALLPFGPSPLARQLIPTMQPPEFLPLFFERHPSAFLRDSVAAISRAARGGVLYYTLLYGSAFSVVLEKQVRWLERLGMTPVMVIALGEEGRRTCRRPRPRAGRGAGGGREARPRRAPARVDFPGTKERSPSSAGKLDHVDSCCAD